MSTPDSECLSSSPAPFDLQDQHTFSEDLSVNQIHELPMTPNGKPDTFGPEIFPSDILTCGFCGDDTQCVCKGITVQEDRVTPLAAETSSKMEDFKQIEDPPLP